MAKDKTRRHRSRPVRWPDERREEPRKITAGEARRELEDVIDEHSAPEPDHGV